MNKNILIIFSQILLLLFLASCNSILLVKNRVKYADNLVKNTDFVGKTIKTDDFYLFSYQKITDSNNKTLNVYIEGDGLAWRNRYELSSNPTPTDPIALKMALKDLAKNVIYIARPCQYVDFDVDNNCYDQEYWSQARFSKEVIDSINVAIDKIKEQYHFKNVNLFGFSGGGAVVALVATKRNDVKFIGTIAANLNHEMFSKIHGTTPLAQSPNPIDFAQKLSKIPQLHLVGESDEIVPKEVVQSFVDEVNKYSKVAKIKIVEGANHEYPQWPELWYKIINKYEK